MEIGETQLVHTRQEWREWLAVHIQTHTEIWLVFYKKSAHLSGISFEDAIEEAPASAGSIASPRGSTSKPMPSASPLVAQRVSGRLAIVLAPPA